MNRILLTMKGHLRPYRSAAIPKIADPTDLNIRTSVMPQVIWVLLLLKVFARSVTVRETVKKFRDYGFDELFLDPTVADLEEVDRAADAAL